jgi:ribosomal protein S18 acetylase RimI-like enzyme
VLPEERQRGFGRTLVEHVLAEARNLDGKQVSVGIISDQAELRRWYQKMGFAEGETKKFEHLPFRVTFLTRAL